MKDYNTIEFTVDEFGDKLWETVGKTLETLIKALYTCKVWSDSEGVVVIEFAFCNGYSYNRLEWTGEEAGGRYSADLGYNAGEENEETKA